MSKEQYDTILNSIKEFKNNLEKSEDFNSEEKKEILDKFIAETMSKNIKSNISNEPPEPTKPQLIEASNFASLVTDTKISQHKDLALFAVYYLAIKKNYEGVTVKDVNEEYKKAYLKPSTNPNVFLRQLAKKGLIMSTGKKDGLTSFNITRSGINEVEEVIKNVK